MDAYKHATTIVNKLVRKGHIAYFAGGWVRDYVMGHPSEDIDIATNASPSQIMDLFPNTILVGLAFGVVIIVLEGHQFEVATFRRDLPYIDGRRPQGIELSTPREDALRRDFTINGMFYDPITETIHDFVSGQEDIEKGIIRTIGDPHERFFEDRLRMLRAFRFSARFGFYIDVETQNAIQEHASKLFPAVAAERVLQELNKMTGYPRFDQAIIEMHQLSILEVIFPEIKGIHLKDLRHLVAAYTYFPSNCPLILYLMQLFPTLSLEKKIEIAKRIKAGNKAIKTLEYIDEVSKTIQKEEQYDLIDDHTWVRLYTNPEKEVALHVLSASLTKEKQESFLQKHVRRQEKLEKHIKRLHDSTPLVTSDLLRTLGILPGKQMGLLLKEAEKIAVTEDLQNKDEVIRRLKSNPLWNATDER